MPLTEPQPSPALSQLGQRWPLDGRTIGIITAGGPEPDAVRSIRQAILDAGMVPLVIASQGGIPEASDGDPVAVQRTFTTARSIEFDATLLADAPAPAPDAYGARDAKADDDLAELAVDSRVVLMLAEVYRHGKALGAWGDGTAALEAVGIATDAPGVATATEADRALEGITELLSQHRVWSRFTPMV